MDSTLLAAIISGSIALLGIIASTLITRSQYLNQNKLQTKELELKTTETEAQLERQLKDFELRTRELEVTMEKLDAEYEAFKQSQFTEILKKRMEVYPKIWGIFVDYMINWMLEGKPRNIEWINEFLTAINHCNSETGVFFSQDFYEKFAEFRNMLLEIRTGNDDDIEVEVTEDDLQQLNLLYFGSSQSSGLAAILKEDLGSYGVPAIKR